jgi:hypothetical protein
MLFEILDMLVWHESWAMDFGQLNCCFYDLFMFVNMKNGWISVQSKELMLNHEFCVRVWNLKLEKM